MFRGLHDLNKLSCQALCVVYLQIVHLDLKTPNILLARDFTAKLADVGLARIKRTDYLTALDGVVGTYVYAAPEVHHCHCLVYYSFPPWTPTSLLQKPQTYRPFWVCSRESVIEVMSKSHLVRSRAANP